MHAFESLFPYIGLHKRALNFRSFETKLPLFSKSSSCFVASHLEGRYEKGKKYFHAEVLLALM